MFKKIFSLFTCIAAIGVGLLGLTSCTNNTNLIEVKDFTTDKTYYVKDETVTFDITIKVKDSDVTVLAADIESNNNDQKFTVALTSNDNYHFTGSSTYDGTTTRFKLTKVEFSYIDSKNNLVASEITVRNLSSGNIGENEGTNSSNIYLKSININNPEKNDIYYIDQQINVMLSMNNPYERKITYFEFKLNSVYGEHTFSDTLTYNNADFLKYDYFDFELTLPSDIIGDATLTLTKVKYIDSKLKEQTLELNSGELKSEFKIDRRGVTYQSIELGNLGSVKNTTYNGLKTVESGTSLPIKITLLNEDLMIPTVAKVNGTEYKLNSSNYTTNSISKTTVINLTIGAPTVNSSQISKVDIKLEKITLQKNKDLTVNYTPNENSVKPVSLYVVNKLITSKEDLESLFATSNVTGYNLVTSNIDMQNTSLHASTLSGTLDFQGKTLSNWQSTKPMFDTISESGVLKNISVQNVRISTEENSKYSGFLARTNNGLINNIKISNLKQVANSTHHYFDDSKTMVGTKLGLVETNGSTGMLTNIDMTTEFTLTWTSGYNVHYAPIFTYNYGQVAYINFTGKSFTYNASVAFTEEFELLGKTNEGTITSVIFDITSDASHITTALYHLTPREDNGTTTNIFVSELTVKKALTGSNEDFDVNKTGNIQTLLNVLSILPQNIINGTNADEQFSFFNSLGFNNSGSGFVWVYGSGQGKLKLIYK